MSSLPGGSFLFAWYSVEKAGLETESSQNIFSLNDGQIDGKSVTAAFVATEKCNLTTDDGVVKVWNGQTAVAAKDQANLDKLGHGSITLSGTGMEALIGLTYTVKISASDQVRIEAQSSAKTTKDYVGAYAHAGDDDGQGGTLSEDTKIEIGTVTIASATTFTYSSYKNGVAGDTTGLHFYYSLSPKVTNGPENENNPEYSASTSYGTVSIYFE